MDRAREVALKVLCKIDNENAYSNIVLNNELKENAHKLNDKDVGLISEIVYGVTTWKLTIDEIIKKYSKIRLKKISVWILNILRMGIYQIVFLDKIPKSAAVNESVNLAKRYGHKSSSSFVNAILRKVNKNELDEFENIPDEIEKISKLTSMPEWIVNELAKYNTLDETRQICRNLNEKPKVTIRVNTLKTNKEELKAKLEEMNIKCFDTELEDFLAVEKMRNIENMELFKNGMFTVQDISAGKTAIVLDPKEGDVVLDACSAPGGKTTHIAELMNNKGKIVAWELHEHRCKLVEKNANRLGIEIIDVFENDATKFDETKIESFDKILLDVPCLGIGVIRRKPDIKWQRKLEDIENIACLQYKILDNCSKYLKKGGCLVYSTCSILEKENAGITRTFVDANKEYEIVDEQKILPSLENDGFYICKIIKK